MRQIRDELGCRARGLTLEIGCGRGTSSGYYREGRVIAVDRDDRALRQATRRLTAIVARVELVQAVAERLPFADASFDTVVSCLVLCAVTDRTTCLREVRRVLHRGGIFVFAEHVPAERGMLAGVQGLVPQVWRRIGAGCQLRPWVASELERVGLHEIRVRLRRLTLLTVVVGEAQAS